MRRLLPVLLFFLALAGAAGARAEPMQWPGSNWTIEPPAGYEFRTTPIAFFVHPAGAYVMVTDLGRETVTAKDLGQVGQMTNVGTPDEGRLESAEETTVGGKPAVLAHLRMTVRNADAVALIVTGTGSNVMLIGAIPDKARSTVSMEDMIATLMSVRENVQTDDQLLASLPFVLPELEGLRIVQVMMGSMVIIGDGTSMDFDAEPGKTSAMILATDGGDGRPLDLERDAEPAKKRLLQQYPDAIFTSATRDETPRGPVLALRYSRKIRASGATVAGVAWVRQDGGFMLVMIGQHDPAKPGEEARLARIRDGVVKR